MHVQDSGFVTAEQHLTPCGVYDDRAAREGDLKPVAATNPIRFILFLPELN
jgi:hypothetical protein